MLDMEMPILVTKLHVPTRRRDLVTRPRLVDRLDAGVRQQQRLTLVSAPAGYGKTTLVTDWLAGQDAPIAWLSLDEADNDPHRFLEYLVAALQRLDPEYGAGVRSLLHGSQPADGTACLTLLLNDLAAADDLQILVLDDYHLIRTAEIHEMLDFLLEYAPRTLHLVLLTREDPPLALSRLRARGQLTEVRAADLRFTSKEIAAFFRETLDLTLDADALSKLAARTEGWVASLQLAGLALRSQKEQSAFLERFSGSHRYVIDYLLDEVLRQQPPEVREFLIRTSILDRFCAPLCDALLVPDDDGADAPDSPADEILRDLERANLFLVPLDDHRTWYRYHHLFADVLRSDLSTKMARTLHRRAADWYIEAGLQHEAIRHALAAGDFVSAAAWITAAADGLIRNGRIVTLLDWLDALPQPVIAEHPDLLTNKALGLLLAGKLDAVEATLSDLEALGMADMPEVQGYMLTVRAWLADARGLPRVPDTAERALALLPEEATLFRILALIPLSHARTAAGDVVGSTEALRAAYHLAEDADQPFAVLGALANLAFNLLEQGERREALALCEVALSQYVDHRGRPLPVLGLVYLPLATIHYLGDSLAKAEQYARKGLALCRQLFSDAMAGGDAERVLAQTHFVRGEPEQAFALLDKARRTADQRGITHVALVFASMAARLRLRQGEIDVVEQWIEALSRPIPPEAEFAYLEWLVASRRWDEVEPLLRERARHLVESGQFGRLIFVHLLQAQAAAGQGERAAALAYLESALQYAAPEGYRRPFLDAPAEVQMLLPHVQAADVDFVEDLIARSDLDVTTAPEAPPSLSSDYLLDPLSERELEVLGLIAAGLSNREIAEHLFITVGTVKRHAHNLYGKLRVSNRTQAVARAREIGLL
jgi:LuxR family maltose regulon positive regulatory protein